MAEIARNIGIGTSAVAMALKQKEAEIYLPVQLTFIAKVYFLA